MDLLIRCVKNCESRQDGKWNVKEHISYKATSHANARATERCLDLRLELGNPAFASQFILLCDTYGWRSCVDAR